MASARLYKLVEAQVPISVTLDYDADNDSRVMIVNKYMGMDEKVGLEIAYNIRSNVGITEGPAAGRPVVTPADERRKTAGGVRFSPDGGVRFSSAAHEPETPGRDVDRGSQDIW